MTFKKTFVQSKKNALKESVGRKLFDGKNQELVLQKLEQAFSLGSSNREACIYAGISEAAFYEFQKKNRQFLEKKTLLKQKPILKARKTIVDHLDDPKIACWYLERKKREEFSTRQIVHNETPSYEMPPEALQATIAVLRMNGEDHLVRQITDVKKLLADPNESQQHSEHS